MKRSPFFLAAVAAVCLLTAACSRSSSAAAAEVLQALAATAALTDYAVVADTTMTVQGDTGADGLSMTQCMWRTGDNAMQKMTTYDAQGRPLFENGSALVDGVYYWYDGKHWAPDDTGIAASANLDWMPKVNWPKKESDLTVTENDGTYTVTVGKGAFPAMIEEQVAAMQEEEKALEAQGLTREAEERRAMWQSAEQAEYEELRYTIEVENGVAVACTTYSRVRQPDTGAESTAGMPVSEITYTWRLTGTDAAQIADIIGEAAARGPAA